MQLQRLAILLGSLSVGATDSTIHQPWCGSELPSEDMLQELQAVKAAEVSNTLPSILSQEETLTINLYSKQLSKLLFVLHLACSRSSNLCQEKFSLLGHGFDLLESSLNYLEIEVANSGCYSAWDHRPGTRCKDHHGGRQ